MALAASLYQREEEGKVIANAPTMQRNRTEGKNVV